MTEKFEVFFLHATIISGLVAFATSDGGSYWTEASMIAFFFMIVFGLAGWVCHATLEEEWRRKEERRQREKDWKEGNL